MKNLMLVSVFCDTTGYCFLFIGLSQPLMEYIRSSGIGWFAGLMCTISLFLLLFAAITTIRCHIGAIYPGLSSHAHALMSSAHVPQNYAKSYLNL